MKNMLIKAIAVFVSLLTLANYSQAQNATVSTTISGGAGIYLLTTNRAKVYSVETTTTNAVTFKLWDNDNTNSVPLTSATGFWGTNFVNAAYISRSTYPTNFASSYVSTVGFTNWYTNAGIWSVTVTNAASTNALAPFVTVANGGAETRVTYADALFTRGIVVGTTGNGTVTVYYRVDSN